MRELNAVLASLVLTTGVPVVRVSANTTQTDTPSVTTAVQELKARTGLRDADGQQAQSLADRLASTGCRRTASP